uniref:Putative glycosyl hydrolase family5 n=1 Tax=uncultured symbiotic protist of Hodotermopsis sjoestedti TaxID=403659 RepID=A4UWS2_9EUKA|nr:putative glycosyl hydrolase family5 [uncultured symbiotic protist of Hodotermopsis sjoestedti]BAF57338.1 putative glycosyl hydrolase family5 [uncultured symbiotic protist of Hodotermopsis sjoestedti]BAF57339.1 putative glycosyl hydrolase family5 [uncultured symbiotic protist of Hodotermopsis sjoestedti]
MFAILCLIGIVQSNPPFGRLSVKGNQIVGESQKGIQLRGVGLSWHNWWHQFYNADTVKHLKNDFHANVVRAAIGVEKEGGYYDDQNRAYEDLYAVIDAAIANGIYVIVDWQAFQIHLSDATSFFTKVATKYHSSSYIIYELFNEPESASWSEIKSYSESLIKTIRAIDPDNLILVPTPNWDQYVKQAAADPITIDNNIAYTIHIYVGTHPLSYIDDAKEALKKIPLFGTEIGAMNADGDGALDRAKFTQWINFYEENKISYLAWAVQSKQESDSILKPSENWNDLSEWGTLFKETITRYQ